MQCKYCGQPIADNSNYCSNCGRAAHVEATELRRERKFWEQGWFAVLMLFVFWPVGLYLLWKYHGIFAKAIVSIFLFMFLSGFIIALGNGLHIGESDDLFVKSAHSVIAESVPSQERFNEIQLRYNQNEKKTMTELEKAEFKKSYEREFNEFFKSGYVKKWCGKVYSIESEKSGMAAYVKLNCYFPEAKYTFETKKYSIDETLIPADSELYKKIMSLQKGDIVVFSGKLVNNDYSKKIVDLTTPYGYMNEKIYIKFTDIEKMAIK